jgi:sulfur-carrier protein
MPHVQVSLYAALREYVGRAPSVDVEIAAGQTIHQVLDHLHVPPEKARIIFVNHRSAGLDDPLQGGEQIGVFPAIGGG